jgi:hypothetical protein
VSALLFETSEQTLLMLQRGHGQVGRLRRQRDLRCLHDLYHEELQFMRLTLKGDNND